MDVIRDSIQDYNPEWTPSGVPFGIQIPSRRHSGFHSGFNPDLGADPVFRSAIVVLCMSIRSTVPPVVDVVRPLSPRRRPFRRRRPTSVDQSHRPSCRRRAFSARPPFHPKPAPPPSVRHKPLSISIRTPLNPSHRTIHDGADTSGRTDRVSKNNSIDNIYIYISVLFVQSNMNIK